MSTSPVRHHSAAWRFSLLLCSLPLIAVAADHIEGTDGDLSDDPSNPTPIAVNLGDNVIRGQVTDSPLDRDIFTLQVPADVEITELQLSGFQLLSAPSDGGMLVALEEGSQITDTNSSADLRGFVIAGVVAGTQQGDDLLDNLGGGTLGEGDWTIWIQNTGSVTDYELTVQAQALAVPPPTPPPPPTQRLPQNVPVLSPLGWLVLIGGILWIARGARRRT